MSPPGIASVSLAPWALDAIEGERGPRFYWDLRKARKNLPLGESAFTPAVSLIFAVGEALTMMREEGLANVHARHRRLGAAARVRRHSAGRCSPRAPPTRSPRSNRRRAWTPARW
jgi:aspartate aminotransferase-like enzyme